MNKGREWKYRFPLKRLVTWHCDMADLGDQERAVTKG